MENYEQKYKDALERAKEAYETYNIVGQRKVLAEIFPELRENEDEMIKRNDANLLDEINRYYKEVIGGQYITYAMYKKIARHFYFLDKNN